MILRMLQELIGLQYIDIADVPMMDLTLNQIMPAMIACVVTVLAYFMVMYFFAHYFVCTVKNIVIILKILSKAARGRVVKRIASKWDQMRAKRNA